MELSTEKVFHCGNDCEREQKHEMMLDLSLGEQKSENLFAGSDQTPTPTRLIRNCEEVGLFEDLRHVNPFEETFRRACEQQSAGQTPIRQLDSVEVHVDENSLHTPQVYPQAESIQSCEMLGKPLDSPPVSGAVILDVPTVVDEFLHAATDVYKLGTSRQNSNNSNTSSSGGYKKYYKYRAIAEKPPPPAATACGEVLLNELGLPCAQLPTTIQLIQPQLITLTFPGDADTKGMGSSLEASKPLGGLSGTSGNAIPIQTVKPFIMPKLAPAPVMTPTTIATITTPENRTAKLTTNTRTTLTTLTTKNTSSSIRDTCPQPCSSSTNTTTPTKATSTTKHTLQIPPPREHEPSSASLTPTSQLPIKERLKAILSQGNKAHNAAMAATTQQMPTPVKANSRRTRNEATAAGAGKYDEDSMVRRRAAATRYRNKMRNEQKELRRKNGELQAENEKLRARIKQMEQDLVQSQQQQQQAGNGNLQAVPAQVQIPPSTLHLVMNIPTMLVPTGGQPSLVQPITYRVEKK